jgi:hypothetical protein
MSLSKKKKKKKKHPPTVPCWFKDCRDRHDSAGARRRIAEQNGAPERH